MFIIKYFWVFCLIVGYIFTWVLVIRNLKDDVKYVKSKYDVKGLDFILEVFFYNDGFVIFLIIHIVIFFLISLCYFILTRG